MKRGLRLGLIAVLVVGLLPVVVALRMSGAMEAPMGGTPSVIRVERGTTLKRLLADLEQKGVMPHPTLVYWAARFKKQTDVRAGWYDVGGAQTPATLLRDLTEGRVKTGSFTIAEGLNRWQVRDLLAKGAWMDGPVFDKLCDDAGFLAKHDVPGPSCDGYLFPETYTFAYGVAPEQIFTSLFAFYKKELRKVTQKGFGPLGFDERKLVTLASIVEKETAAPEERPHIACVFYNRLQAKPAWRLETDPTVIYAATLADPKFDGNITAFHLHKLENPYNTYRVFGLPPGPIASPGRDALAAVVSPATCPDFFFVSMNNGHHRFCPDLKCHEAGVDRFQRGG